MRPATRPASALASSANGAGVATSATQSRKPAQRPGSSRRQCSTPKRRSGVTDLDDLPVLQPARCLDLGDIAGFLADQRACDRARDRDQTQLEVGLVVADDLIGDLGAAVLVLEVDRRAEDDLAAGVERRRVDDLRGSELAFELLDPALD